MIGHHDLGLCPLSGAVNSSSITDMGKASTVCKRQARQETKKADSTPTTSGMDGLTCVPSRKRRSSSVVQSSRSVWPSSLIHSCKYWGSPQSRQLHATTCDHQRWRVSPVRQCINNHPLAVLLARLPSHNMADGPLSKLHQSPRVTKGYQGLPRAPKGLSTCIAMRTTTA